ncbi:hypothetical protein [Bartonella sp. B30(2025)]
MPKPYIIIKNSPTNKKIFFSPDPDIYTPSAKSGNVSENFLTGIASLIGEPYSIQFEGKELVNNLIPKLKSKSQYTGIGFDVELDFHIENAALKHFSKTNVSPTGLLLFGIRQDPKGPLTKISDSRISIKELSQEDINTLSSKFYNIKLPYRWRISNSPEYEETPLVPIISKDHEYPDISAVFYPGMIKSSSTKAEKALKNFYKLIKKNSIAIDISPGDLSSLYRQQIFITLKRQISTKI